MYVIRSIRVNEGQHTPGAKAALDLDMESGTRLRLYNDGTRYRTRIVRTK